MIAAEVSAVPLNSYFICSTSFSSIKNLLSFFSEGEFDLDLDFFIFPYFALKKSYLFCTISLNFYLSLNSSSYACFAFSSSLCFLDKNIG